jgi:hypothetical protein
MNASALPFVLGVYGRVRMWRMSCVASKSRKASERYPLPLSVRMRWMGVPCWAYAAMTSAVKAAQSLPRSDVRSSTTAWREWSSTATWAYCHPAPSLRPTPSLRMRLPTCQKRPSFLMSKCTSSPTAAYSYRFGAGRGWRWAREQPCRTSTRQIVEAGHPSAAERLRGPHPVWRRNATICASASAESRCGQCLAIDGRSRNPSQPPW